MSSSAWRSEAPLFFASAKTVEFRSGRQENWRSRDYRSIADSRRAEHAAVAFDFGSRAERLRVVVGKLDRLPAVNLVHLADQTDRVKSTSPARIATPEVI